MKENKSLVRKVKEAVYSAMMSEGWSFLDKADDFINEYQGRVNLVLAVAVS